jgi:phosphoribosylformimino-5-aminoimidazole carboxamide ribotide isomerase
MLIIPAIDIRGGKCVRLFQGDYGKETLYGEDPVEMASRWTAEGAGFLHLVDLDGAREGAPRNREVIGRILKTAAVPVQVGGGIRSLADIEGYFSSGAARVILGTAAYADPGFLAEACRRWPGRIAVDIAARSGKAAVSGWTRETPMPALEFARRCESLGASWAVYTDILRDGAQQGINLESTRLFARSLHIPVIASGGVSTPADLEALLPLESEGVRAVIVGRALYAGTLDLREALALTRKERR